MEPSHDELEHLLSKGRLSGARRERLFEKVYARAVPRRRLWQRLAFASLAPAIAVACLAVWTGRHGSSSPHDGFRARGAGTAGPSIELGCADGAHDRCPAGGVLVFRVAELREGGYFAAWIEPTGGGERVWFAPNRSAAAVPLQASAAPQLLPDGYRLGSAPGAYTVHARVLREPLDRDGALVARGDAILAERTFPLEVTP